MNIRDLFVGIDIDVDDNPLHDLDSLVDDVKESIIELDASGLDEIERDVQSLADEFDDLSREISDVDRNIDILDGNDLDELRDDLIATSIQTNILEDDVEDLVEEEREAIITTSLLGDAFTLTGFQGIAMGIGITGALGLLTAILAPLLVLVGGLGASFLAVGAGVVAFGAVAMGALGPVIAGAEDLTAAQAKTRTELESFTSFWGDFVQQFEAPIFTAFGHGLDLIRNIFEGLEPTIGTVSNMISELMKSMNDTVVDGGLKSFFDWLETNAADSILNFAHIIGSMLGGAWKVFEAFTPIGKTIEQGLLSMTSAFNEWAGNLGNSNGFQQFMDYAMENGPVLWETLGNIWSIGQDVVVALAPLGTIVLAAFEQLTGKISEFTPYLTDIVNGAIDFGEAVVGHWTPIQETVIGLGVAVGSFAIIMKGLQIIGVINTLMSAYRAGTLVATAAQIGLNLAMLANPVTWVVAGIAALIAIGVLLYRNWDTVKVKAGELWSKTKEVFSAIFDWGASKIKPVTDFFKGLGDKFNDFKSAISSFKMPAWVSSIGDKLGSAASKVKVLFDGSHADGLGRVPFDGYIAELHKDEAILTAEQSNALRDLGILNGDGSSPELDLSDSGGNYTTTNSNSNTNVNNVFNINVQGGNTDEETAFNLIESLEEFFGDLRSIKPRVREG